MITKSVSIIIPTFNRGYIIEKSIKSILNQTYKNFELIIVDDCSEDDTEEIVKKINDIRIKYIKLRKNSGANKARNIGIDNAKFDIIAFHDSDDEWHSNKLEKQLKFLIDGNYDIVSCKYNQYLNSKLVQVIPDENILLVDNLLKKILYGNFISTQTILGKKECFEKEKFDETFPRFQDWELAIRLIKNYKIGFQNIALVDVHIQENSISKNTSKGLIALKKIYKKYYRIISEDKNLDSFFNQSIYINSLLNRTPQKKFIKRALKLRVNKKNIIFYTIFLFKLEKLYYNYYMKKEEKM